jgi:catechol 2,3-dioxygenase-like lactoylglutathione lyase family enzyme
MLARFSAATMIPAKDLQRTRRFYEGVLGFSPAGEHPGAVIYRSAGSQFNLYETESGGTAEHTLMGWMVDDIEAVVRDLAGRGVAFERYDMPRFRTDSSGIADMGEDRGAWFKDPEGNLLSVWQKPQPARSP